MFSFVFQADIRIMSTAEKIIYKLRQPSPLSLKKFEQASNRGSTACFLVPMNACTRKEHLLISSSWTVTKMY